MHINELPPGENIDCAHVGACSKCVISHEISIQTPSLQHSHSTSKDNVAVLGRDKCLVHDTLVVCPAVSIHVLRIVYNTRSFGVCNASQLLYVCLL